MTKRAAKGAAPAVPAKAAPDAAATSTQSAGAPPPADTPSDGGAESMVSADGQAGVTPASNAQPANGADSVSSSVAGEAAPFQSGAASDDTQRVSEGGRSAPEAGASASASEPDAAATGQPLRVPVEFDQAQVAGDSAATEDDELLYGLPRQVKILHGHIDRDRIIGDAIIQAEHEGADFHDLSIPTRADLLDLVIAFHRAAAEIEERISQLLAPRAAGMVEITAKSRDGRPFRRAGHEWTGEFQTKPVPVEAHERLKTDPNLVVKADA